MKLLLCVALTAVLCQHAVLAEGPANQKVTEWSDKSQASAVTTSIASNDTPSRQERAAKENKKEKKEKKVRADNCKYVKGAWSECNTKTNMRTRTLTLKKGDASSCEATRLVEKKCKGGKSGKGCQYEKGAWSSCSAQNQMIRTDRLKPSNDPNNGCEPTRQVTRNCKNKKGKENKQKVGSNRRNKQ